jgi:hypothetical protein
LALWATAAGAAARGAAAAETHAAASDSPAASIAFMIHVVVSPNRIAIPLPAATTAPPAPTLRLILRSIGASHAREV